jgi:hypothetical protein
VIVSVVEEKSFVGVESEGKRFFSVAGLCSMGWMSSPFTTKVQDFSGKPLSLKLNRKIICVENYFFD